MALADSASKRSVQGSIEAGSDVAKKKLDMKTFVNGTKFALKVFINEVEHETHVFIDDFEEEYKRNPKPG